MIVYVVLGMHRSGTSLVAQMLYRLGVDVGHKLLGPNDWNPHGHWEDVDFITLNEAILQAAGGDWGQPPPHDRIVDAGRHYAPIIRQMIAVRAQHGKWGWKDPRTCLTAAVYHPNLDNAHYIRVLRDEEAIVRSLHKRAHESTAVLRRELAEGAIWPDALAQLKRGTWTLEQWRNLACDYHARTAAFLDAVDAPRIELHFEDLLGDNARGYVKELARFVGSGKVDEAMEAIGHGNG